MKSEPVHHPLIGVHDETIYHVLNDVRGQSWFDKCNALEAALVAAGWTPPDGHPLASATPSQDEDRLRCTHYLCPPADVPNCDVRGCLLKKQMINDEVTDDMLNAGQERMCEVSSNTYFDDYTQAEIFKAMLAAKGAFRAGVESATPSQDLRDALELILPMAKGYASAHRVGSNADKIAHAEQALASSATPSPGGWKLVPVEPTDEMIEACESALAEWRKTLPPDELVLRGKWKSGKLYHDAEQAEKHAIRYRAMLNAAPSPPTEPTGGEG